MAYRELDYRFGAAAQQAGDTTQSRDAKPRPNEVQARPPNRISLAKKRWWAEKKAREAAEGDSAPF